MADDGRLDLNAELEKAQNDLLSDVKAATDEVKQRQAARKLDADRSVERAKSRRLSALLVGIGAVVVLLLSYWIVFARPDQSGPPQATRTAASQSRRAPAVAIKCPGTAPSRASAAGGAASTPAGRDSQLVEHPSDEYEPPSGNSGM
jgi:hypothetical protein